MLKILRSSEKMESDSLQGLKAVYKQLLDAWINQDA